MVAQNAVFVKGGETCILSPFLSMSVVLSRCGSSPVYTAAFPGMLFPEAEWQVPDEYSYFLRFPASVMYHLMYIFRCFLTRWDML